MYSTNCSNVSYRGRQAYLNFLLTLSYEKDLYHQQSDAVCGVGFT